MNTEWHFSIMGISKNLSFCFDLPFNSPPKEWKRKVFRDALMIVASLLILFVIVRFVLAKTDFNKKRRQIFLLAIIVVVFGMLFGKYGATYGLPWWLYYPVPMLITVILPPFVLKLNTRQTAIYLVLSFLSAPFIHVIFSFFSGWTEYMPFWKVPMLPAYIN